MVSYLTISEKIEDKKLKQKLEKAMVRLKEKLKIPFTKKRFSRQNTITQGTKLLRTSSIAKYQSLAFGGIQNPDSADRRFERLFETHMLELDNIDKQEISPQHAVGN